MVLVMHIIIAVSGLFFTAFSALNPSHQKITISSYFLAGTIISGSALVIHLQTGLLRACVSGLTLSAAMYTGIAIAKRRLETLNAG